MADDNSASDKLAPQVCIGVDPRLSELVIEHLLDGKRHQGKVITCFDFSEVAHGYHIIVYKDQLTRKVPGSSVPNISGEASGKT